MAFYVVNYTYRSDVDLDSVRPRHREFLGQLVEQGLLRASGPLVDVDPPAAVLVFEADSAHEVADALKQDPFAEAGFIADTQVLEWHPVIGIFAS